MAPQFCSDCGTILHISAEPTIACDICGTSQKSDPLPPPPPSSLYITSNLLILVILCRQAPQHRHHHALRPLGLPLAPAQPPAGARARRPGHRPRRADHQHGVPAVRRPRGRLEPGAAAQRGRGHDDFLRVQEVWASVRFYFPFLGRLCAERIESNADEGVTGGKRTTSRSRRVRDSVRRAIACRCSTYEALHSDGSATMEATAQQMAWCHLLGNTLGITDQETERPSSPPTTTWTPSEL